MKPHIFLILLLSFSTAAASAPLAGDPGNATAAIKSAVDRDWVARVESSGDVTVSSPSYAMPFGQGCVIHQLSFLSDGQQPSLGRMVSTDQYFVFAAGDACASTDPEQYFSIEPGNDVVALLDFARRLKEGPKTGRDRVPEGAFEKMSACFAAEAMRATRIVRAHSWRPKGGSDKYQVTLACEALRDQGELVAIGTRGQDAVSWQVATLDRVIQDGR